MTTDDEVAGRLRAAREGWRRLTSPGDPLADLAGGPDSGEVLDHAVRRLEGVWAGTDAPLGTDPAPPWAGARGMRVLVGSVPAGALPVLDAMAVRTGDLEVAGAEAVGARWAMGTGRDTGLLVVTDDGRGVPHEPVRSVFGCVRRIRSGDDPAAVSRLVRELVGTRLRTEEDWARQSLESFSPWETYLLRPAARGLLRRRPQLDTAAALAVVADLTGDPSVVRRVDPAGALGEHVFLIDPGVGWWRAVVSLDPAAGTRGEAGVDAVRVTVTGGPEDSERGTDPGNLGLLLHRVRRVAEAHGVEVERTVGPGRSRDDEPSPVP